MMKLTELRRRHERAEAEVAELRRMVRTLAAELDAVPEKSISDIRLIQEAITLAGSPLSG